MHLHINYITMIYINYCALYTIHHAAFNYTPKYTSLHPPMYALNTSLSTLPSMISSMLPIALNYTFLACFTLWVTVQLACDDQEGT
jgi:hypothetical protein